jgi:hypothetical protein
MRQQPPFVFVVGVWGLVTVGEQALFAKAKEVFQVIPPLIRLENIQQREFATTVTHDNQPERTLESQLAGHIKQANPHQSKRVQVHGERDGFAFARHAHIVPGFNL